MASDSDSDCLPLNLETDSQQDVPVPNQQVRFSLWNTAKQHLPRLLVTVLVDLILPMIVYLILQKRTNPVHALLAAGIPPLIMVLIKGILSRTFDALGFLVFIAFSASAVAAVITHNPVILLLEKSLVTGIISIVFAITLIPLHCCHRRCYMRPLAYYFYQDLVPTKRADVGLPDILFENEPGTSDEQGIELLEESTLPSLTHKQEVAQVYEWIYAHCSSFRRSCYLITSIWALGLLLEFFARLFLILIHLSIEQIFIYGHIILSLMTSLLILLTVLCITRERKQTLKLIEQWKKHHLILHQSPLVVHNLNINIIT